MREYLSRDEARRIKKKKRRRQVIFYYIVIIALLLVGAVFLIRKTVSLLSGRDMEEFSITEDISGITDEIKEDIEGAFGQNGDPDGESEKEPDYLGYNPTVKSDGALVHGTRIYSGYDIKKTDSTYYITSENMMSNYAILVDAVNGNVVCQKEGFTRINPASMTKILTALVAAEHIKEEDLEKKKDDKNKSDKTNSEKAEKKSEDKKNKKKKDNK